MNLRQWLAVPYDGPGRRRAALLLWLRDCSETWEAKKPGPFMWRWRYAAGLNKIRRLATGAMQAMPR